MRDVRQISLKLQRSPIFPSFNISRNFGHYFQDLCHEIQTLNVKSLIIAQRRLHDNGYASPALIMRCEKVGEGEEIAPREAKLALKIGRFGTKLTIFAKRFHFLSQKKTRC